MADGLPKSAGHPFYQRLNALLAEVNFDRWIERRCQRYYVQEEIVAGKSYHAAETIELADDLNFRTYIPERKKKHRSRWTDKPAESQPAVYANRRRLKRAKSRQLQRWRSERCERTFAHLCDSGGMWRSWLTEVVNVSKRYLAAAAAHNLGRILRKLFGIGKPRTLQDLAALAALVPFLVGWRLTLVARCRPATTPDWSSMARVAGA